MKRALPAITVALAALAVASVAFAGDDVTSLSYISYLERYATLRPAHNEEALDAVVNMPVLAGDRLDTSRGARVEVQLADGTTVWVDEFSTVDFDALAFSRDDSSAKTALYLAQGTVAVEIPATAAGEGTMRFDSPSGPLYLNRPGLYRLELSGDEIHVQAYSGLAELPVGVGSAILRGGEEATVGANGELEKASLSDRTDDFWNWVQERRHPTSGPTAQYVDTRAAGRAAVLDNYGDWVYVPTFSSWMWRPRVSFGWVPYSYGRWYWTPVGWDWISYEPWGWYPFHYGSWYMDASFGWVWGWDSVWSPAWVYWMYTPGYVGWCPRGYYDWWYWHQYRGTAGYQFPSRWSEVTFGFSGRVRLGAVDPHPWTFVGAGQFTNTHLERVRLNPERFLRDLPGDRTGVVRSGPLVTSTPSRGFPDRGVESFFRLGTNEREVPDLSSVLRREPGSGARGATVNPVLTPSRTRDLGGAPRLQLPGVTTGGGRDGTDNQPNRERARPEVQRGQANPGGSNPPPVVVRRQIDRPNTSGTRQAPPREVVRPQRVEGDGNRSKAPSNARPAAPPPAKSRNDSSASVDERSWGRVRGDPAISNDRWSAGASRREVNVQSYARPQVTERLQPRSVESQRVVVPREVVRSSAASRAPVPAVRNAPAAGASSAGRSAPRSVAPPASGNRSQSRRP